MTVEPISFRLSDSAPLDVDTEIDIVCGALEVTLSARGVTLRARLLAPDAERLSESLRFAIDRLKRGEASIDCRGPDMSARKTPRSGSTATARASTRGPAT